MKLPKDQTILAIVAIVSIAGLEALWVWTGHNSISMTVAVGSIMTIAGYGVGFKKGKEEL